MYPKAKQQLVGADKKYPVVCVDTAALLTLMMSSPHLQRCIAERAEELKVNMTILGTDYEQWAPSKPDTSKVIDVDFYVHVIVIMVRSCRATITPLTICTHTSWHVPSPLTPIHLGCRFIHP